YRMKDISTEERKALCFAAFDAFLFRSGRSRLTFVPHGAGTSLQRNAQSHLDALHGNERPEAFYIVVAEKEPSRQRLVIRHRAHDDDQDEIRLSRHIIALLHLRRGGEG